MPYFSILVVGYNIIIFTRCYFNNDSFFIVSRTLFLLTINVVHNVVRIISEDKKYKTINGYNMYKYSEIIGLGPYSQWRIQEKYTNTYKRS